MPIGLPTSHFCNLHFNPPETVEQSPHSPGRREMSISSWKRWELLVLVLYAVAFYSVIIRRSLQLSRDYHTSLHGLRGGWISNRLNDLSDAQWRNLRGNLPILSIVMSTFTTVANILKWLYRLKGEPVSVIWILISLLYLSYLHGACVVFVLSIASMNYFLVKILEPSRYYMHVLWIWNIAVLLLNRVFEGYPFSLFGQNWAFLDNYRGTFRWHICFNLVVLRMISFGCDYHWSKNESLFDRKKHAQNCSICSSGKACYVILQLDMPQKIHSTGQVAWYGFRWLLSLFLMEAVTHFFYYNAFAISGLWRQLSPLDIFIIGYGVLNFMWLKFFLIWRYFRFWSLIGGIEAPENMPRCINNCYDLESFWKSWHASFNKWLVRYMYIPLGGSRRKLLNVWVVFTFVAIWHDLEWKLLSWAWLTCIFLIPEIVIKSSANTFKIMLQ